MRYVKNDPNVGVRGLDKLTDLQFEIGCSANFTEA